MMAPILEGLNVLVVEDQYYIADEMRRTVRGLGGQVIGPAKDAESALGLIEAHGLPDLAVLDVDLGGSSIYPVAEVLRSHGAPFIFASGYEPWAVEAPFRSTPFAPKPVTAAGFIAALRRLPRFG